MKKVLLTVALSSLALTGLRADLIWYEPFNYADGNLTNVSGGVWTNFSGTLNLNMLVNNHRLEVATTGGSSISRADDDARWLGSPYDSSVQVLYASFTVICTNLPNGPGSYFASFYKQGSPGGFCGKTLAFTNFTVLPKTWRVAASGNASVGNTAPANGGYPVDLALNTPYQIVEELDPVTLVAATIWVNPININQSGNPGGPNPPTETHYTSSDSFGFATTTPVNAYAFRQASSFGNGFWLVTNLALATTFAEAATNIWATNAVPPTIVYQPIGVTNYVGASISLGAVANGQGLGNLTYQWQKSASPNNSSPSDVSNPNGNSNILPISPAQTSDTGYYTLIVTTPYGLSTTSSVAYVSISAAPVPPSFVIQPVSQTVYRGQSVTFSTTVVSPGNVTFTWYSNNVVVTDGVTSSGATSSLQLDNVTTNASGSYQVAVTNDVAVNGVVSSNAVLTVRNPQAVTIAYLRTLVDSAYNPTNIPPTIPYQVTGTVTTFTNLTTGNTSSYYLQDGTAGINIFVTGGSAFRPAQGAVVTFVGVLSAYTSGLELYADSTAGSVFPYTSYTDTGATDALPAPIPISFDVANNLDNLNYNLQGSLVKLSDVYFGTNAGVVLSTSGNNTITVTNSSGQQFNLFFAYLDQDTAGQTLPSYAYSVSGALYGHSTTNLAVVVTRFADMVTTAPPSPIPLSMGYSAGILTFTWTDSSFLLQSATNVTGPYTTISGAASGFTTNTTSAPTMFFRLYRP